MSYNKLVRFTKTGQYGCGPEDEDDVYTVDEFRALCLNGMFIDYDGHGYPVRDGLADGDIMVKPSYLAGIPTDATHIVWYNR